MAATTTIRITRQREGTYDTLLLEEDAVILGGTIVCLNAAGYAVPGTSATGLIAWGIATESVDNTDGADGAKKVAVETSRGRKDFFFLNDTGTAVAQADVGNDCYVLDNQTVTGDSTGRSVCGIVIEVTSTGVWVRFKQ
jgi:hypothetical protein